MASWYVLGKTSDSAQESTRKEKDGGLVLHREEVAQTLGGQDAELGGGCSGPSGGLGIEV